MEADTEAGGAVGEGGWAQFTASVLFRKSSINVFVLLRSGIWLLLFCFCVPSLEAAQEPEGQEDYEEESFEFSERENRANNQTLPDMAKRSQMEYYGTYGKGTGRFSNTWIIKTTPNWIEKWIHRNKGAGGVVFFYFLGRFKKGVILGCSSEVRNPANCTFICTGNASHFYHVLMYTFLFFLLITHFPSLLKRHIYWKKYILYLKKKKKPSINYVGSCVTPSSEPNLISTFVFSAAKVKAHLYAALTQTIPGPPGGAGWGGGGSWRLRLKEGSNKVPLLLSTVTNEKWGLIPLDLQSVLGCIFLYRTYRLSRCRLVLFYFILFFPVRGTEDHPVQYVFGFLH